MVPPTPLELTVRDQAILECLVHRIRILSLTQIARTWWPLATEASAAKRLASLKAHGLLEIQDSLIHPEVAVKEALAMWDVGSPPADFGALSYALRSRWGFPPVSTRLYFASARAGRMFGGHG